jgi:transcriptional regulator with XRE-family HTH domain
MEQRYQEELERLGERIRFYRQAKDLTQVDIEIAAKINTGDISRIENGRKNLQFYTIVKLAEALDVQLCQLFPDPETIPQSDQPGITTG